MRGEVGRQLSGHYINTRRNLEQVLDPQGPTSVPKCPDYLDEVYGGDDDKQWQFEELFE